MNVRKTDEFIADVEHQFEWYVIHATWEVAEKYLQAVETTCRLLGQHPLLGPRGLFAHPRLSDWRFFVVRRPFDRHVVFYEVTAGEVVLRRTLHGSRDLPRRLNEPPAQD